MSDKKAEAAPADAAAAAPKKSGMMGKLVVAMFMTMVIVTEVIAFYMFFPNAESVATLAEEKIAKKLATKVAEDDEEEDKSKSEQIEVDLGGFDITAHQPATGATMRITFHLYGTVSELDQGTFDSLKTSTQHRLRDKIIYEVRNSDVSDITDPGLGLIKRRILEKSNELFGKQILRSVIFSDFSFVEQ